MTNTPFPNYKSAGAARTRRQQQKEHPFSREPAAITCAIS
jgi:hypothetical protein